MQRMRRWAWGLGVVLVLGGVLWLLWPDTPARLPDSSASASIRVDGTEKGTRRSGAPVASGVPSRGNGSLRGVVQSLIGEPMSGVSIVALAVPEEGAFFWAGLCRADEMPERPRPNACDQRLSRIEETLEAVQSQMPVLLRTTSAADGTFALTGLKEGVYEVWAEAPHGVAVRKVATGTAGTRFMLEAGVRIEGSTRDERNEPVSGSSVVLLLRDFLRHFETVAGADGHYAFNRVPGGSYLMLGTRDGLLPARAEFGGAAELNVDLVLPDPHVLTGQVVRRGQGVPGARVHAMDGWSEHSAVTDAQGHFTFEGLRPGDYSVDAFNDREAVGVVARVRGAEPTRIVLEFQPCAVLEGGVTTHSGTPLPGAEVFYTLLGQQILYRTIHADARGHYRFDCLLPGPFVVTAEAKGFRRGVLRDDERPLGPGETRRMDFRISEAAPFEGLVVDPEGRGIPGARVWVSYSEDDEGHPVEAVPPRSEANVVTDEDGHFSAEGLSPGSYRVDVAGPSEAFESLSERAQVPNTGVRFVLARVPPRTFGAVAGTVVDERGQPLPGAHIEAERPDHRRGRRLTQTDALGQFRLEKLPLATWRLTATHEGWGYDWKVRATAEVEIHGPEPVFVRLELENGLPVSGVVVDEQGAPVASANVMAPGPLGGAETDAQGRFTLRHMKPGAHEIGASPGQSSAFLLPSQVRARAGDSDVRIVLQGIRRVHGRVVFADGTPVPAFRVNGFSFQGGRFSLPLPTPPPGPLLLRFAAEGLAPTQRHVQVTTGADVVLPDVVMGRGHPVRGRVLDANTGQPLDEAGVVPLDFAPEGELMVDADLGWLWTRADGRFLLPWVEPGAVLTVDRDGYQPVRMTAPQGEEEVVIRLHPLAPGASSPMP